MDDLGRFGSSRRLFPHHGHEGLGGDDCVSIRGSMRLRSTNSQLEQLSTMNVDRAIEPCHSWSVLRRTSCWLPSNVKEMPEPPIQVDAWMRSG